ncbi:hypothetical protein THRCLA_08971 [Thraustotheca clavata]|uniref:Uncharacterized protein n=1 Tax=Thraustotheca clavata TaxID=74557 RepID=A0A1V9Z0B2_9STRA|nr:hypothetical protein THRCLA_08971 [Thraustotheca clavata]
MHSLYVMVPTCTLTSPNSSDYILLSFPINKRKARLCDVDNMKKRKMEKPEGSPRQLPYINYDLTVVEPGTIMDTSQLADALQDYGGFPRFLILAIQAIYIDLEQKVRESKIGDVMLVGDGYIQPRNSLLNILKVHSLNFVSTSTYYIPDLLNFRKVVVPAWTKHIISEKLSLSFPCGNFDKIYSYTGGSLSDMIEFNNMSIPNFQSQLSALIKTQAYVTHALVIANISRVAIGFDGTSNNFESDVNSFINSYPLGPRYGNTLAGQPGWSTGLYSNKSVTTGYVCGHEVNNATELIALQIIFTLLTLAAVSGDLLITAKASENAITFWCFISAPSLFFVDVARLYLGTETGLRIWVLSIILLDQDDAIKMGNRLFCKPSMQARMSYTTVIREKNHHQVMTTEVNASEGTGDDIFYLVNIYGLITAIIPASWRWIAPNVHGVISDYTFAAPTSKRLNKSVS